MSKKKKPNLSEIENISLEEALATAEWIAKKYFGGHYTIYSFTHGYKFSMGTVTDREEIEELDEYNSLLDAVVNGCSESLLKVGFWEKMLKKK
jgi:uncharacterized protein with von Willebrand factor type A (vWA) domain